MKITKLVLMCLCLFIGTTAVWGQAANTQSKPILGYLDAKTGTFKILPQAADVDEAEPRTLATFGGTITITFTITVKTTTLTTFTCTANASVSDDATSATGFHIYTETATVLATGTGTTRTCKVTIPYSWELATQSTDTISIDYVVFGSNGTTATAQRTSTLAPLEIIKVPANGATTTAAAAVTL
jgi:hypothetical protein